MNFRYRRWLATCVTLIAVAITLSMLKRTDESLGDTSTLTGWTLLFSTCGLYLLGLRKRWIALRCGPVAAWMQMHVYLGTFACAVFLMHIGWPVRGLFEGILAATFVVISLSGMGLALLSRLTPRWLAAISQDYRLERIPSLQARLAANAHRVAIESAQLGEGATLSEYYQRRLLPFFQSPRSLLYILSPGGRRRRQLLRELDDLDRYLDAGGVENREELAAMVREKDNLDYHRALQTRLRWLFSLHVALTWALALMITVHVILVYKFQAVL